MPDHHHRIEAMPIQRRHAKRNVLRHLSPQDRIRICRAIHRQIVRECFEAKTQKRDARLRMAIGLPPFRRRTIDLERRQ
jgi:hypothetical protein